MSPRLRAVGCLVGGFPRVSGDEPGTPIFHRDKSTFSPRERG